jgi:YidC/Oxa1 family membrane protein insertase
MRFAKFVRVKDPLVVYSEGLAYRPFLASIVEEYAGRGLPVAYVTSDRDDFKIGWKSAGVTNFYVGFGTKRTWFFQTLPARVVLMTMPDLDTFHIKRSVNPVHYVYTQHSLNSLHMVYRDRAFDSFDTIFAATLNHVSEIRALESLNQSKPKNVVQIGYPTLDQQIVTNGSRSPSRVEGRRRVLLAPSWGINGLIETGASSVIRALIEDGIMVTIRPHVQTQRLAADAVRALQSEFGENSEVDFDLDPGSYESYFSSDLLITAWSGSAFEFAFAQLKPVLFLDTPKKVMNPRYYELDLVPLEVSIRNELGLVVDAANGLELVGACRELLESTDTWIKRIEELRSRTVFNLGSSAKLAANHLQDLMSDSKV